MKTRFVYTKMKYCMKRQILMVDSADADDNIDDDDYIANDAIGDEYVEGELDDEEVN